MIIPLRLFYIRSLSQPDLYLTLVHHLSSTDDDVVFLWTCDSEFETLCVSFIGWDVELCPNGSYTLKNRPYPEKMLIDIVPRCVDVAPSPLSAFINSFSADRSTLNTNKWTTFIYQSLSVIVSDTGDDVNDWHPAGGCYALQPCDWSELWVRLVVLLFRYISPSFAEMESLLLSPENFKKWKPFYFYWCRLKCCPMFEACCFLQLKSCQVYILMIISLSENDIIQGRLAFFPHTHAVVFTLPSFAECICDVFIYWIN